jgi:hypothetical protein
VLASREGVLPEEQGKEIESHVESCHSCQMLRDSFEEAQLPTVRREEVDRVFALIQGQRTASLEVVRRPRNWLWWTFRLVPVAAVLIVVVGLGLLFRFTQKSRDNIVATPPPATASEQPVDFASLVPIDPPPVEIPVDVFLDWRGSSSNPRAPYFRKLAEAMAPYQEKDYRQAEAALTALIEDYPDAPEAHFYEGICLILTDQANEAIRHLEREELFSGTPWERKAVWYLGVGKLRTGDPSGAVEAFRRLCATAGELKENACTAAQRISNTSRN